MALHPRGCNCEGCQESGKFGYPAFQPEESFPSPECWDIEPMKQPRWGYVNPWQKPAPKNMALNGLGNEFYYDPSDFGQAFVPGVVLPGAPSTAYQDVGPGGKTFQPAGLPTDPGNALLVLKQSGQSPDLNTGIAPTLSLDDAEANANDQGLNLNADGTVSALNTDSGISPAMLIGGGLILLLLLK